MSSLSLDVQRAEELVIFKVVHADGGRPMDGFDKTKESRVHSLLHKADSSRQIHFSVCRTVDSVYRTKPQF